MTLDEKIALERKLAQQWREEAEGEKKFKEEVEKGSKGKFSVSTEFISYCEECAEEHEQLAEWLEELKSRIEADNPTKGWIKITSPASNETLIKCPYCEEEFIGKDVEDYKLCPICGKKMREEEQK